MAVQVAPEQTLDVASVPAGIGALQDVVRTHVPWSEENRRLHDEVVEALADAGVFRLRSPRRYGGLEASCAALVEAGAALGRLDGSLGWTASVYWIPTWMACQFPDEVQDEVFSTPDVRICGTLSPSGSATRVDGGVRITGKWGFITGAHHAHWQEILAILADDAGQPYPVMTLVPMSDLLVVDDWQTSGMRGTGSVSTVARDVFVPQERILPLPAVLQGVGASRANAGSPVYQAPLMPVAAASSVGAVVGMAQAAHDVFYERLPHRKITYTAYEAQHEAPVTHLEAAEAALLRDEAQFHADRLAHDVDTLGPASAWQLTDRVRARGDLGAAVRRAKEAVDVLASASGGSSVYSAVAMQRIQRDLHAVHLHALMHPATNAELYGRVLCGLGPNTLYV